MVDEVGHSLCKLLVALGEHSNAYFATSITKPDVQNFFRLMLSYTALPGWYGVDEEESEMTLSFWYLLQEALWTVDFGEEPPSATGGQWVVAKALYVELVKALQRKIVWPTAKDLTAWSRGICFCVESRPAAHSTKTRRRSFRCASFNCCDSQVFLTSSNRYRRDVGDTLINASVVRLHKTCCG